jgi:BASS family bile acid:Na+ symporter
LIAAAKIAIVLIQLSIFLIVLSLGLQGTWRDATSLFRRPAMLARSWISMNAVMPVLATSTAVLFRLNPEVKIALVLLAVSPMPPLLPRKLAKLGGKESYVHGLLTAMALLSIAVVPLAIEMLGKIFGQDAHIGPVTVAKVVGKTILLPLGLGILLNARMRGMASRASVISGRIGNLLLPVTVVPLIIFSLKPIFMVVGNGAVLVMAAFSVVGAAVGHALGGPDSAERTTLALASASRHPGLVMAIAAANFPEHEKLVLAVVLLYLLVSTIVLLPYNAWRKRRMSQPIESAGPQHRAA